MHSPQHYVEAIRRYESGVAFSDIWRQLGLPKGTAAHWIYGKRAQESAAYRASQSEVPCPGCTDNSVADPKQYAYLLGQYLGDGHLVTRTRVPVLRVYCTAAYVKIIHECRRAMLDVHAKAVSVVPKGGCVAVQSYSKHWPCVFPQHGAGMKHQRRIELDDWQQEICSQHPQDLLRGLIHADGCRALNRVTTRGKTYLYPRYFFANESADILRICGEALDRVGAEWRLNRHNSISVAKRDSVALLDTFIGPKS
jgi:hypothetical protein